MFVMERNAKFQLEASENEDVILSQALWTLSLNLSLRAPV